MEYKVLDFMIGKVFNGVNKDEASVTFSLLDDPEVLRYEMYHEQDCCEDVFIEDVTGDLNDLVGHPILRAEVRTSTDETPIASDEYMDDSNTWTFFEFATIKGSVTLRWWGSSNGYYGEDVEIVEIGRTGKARSAHSAYDY